MLVLALFGVALAAQAPKSDVEMVMCADSETRHIRDLMHQGLDWALKRRIRRLYESWMQDETDQPERARLGIEKGIEAYQHGRKQIEAWRFMPCPPPSKQGLMRPNSYLKAAALPEDERDDEEEEDERGR